MFPYTAEQQTISWIRTRKLPPTPIHLFKYVRITHKAFSNAALISFLNSDSHTEPSQILITWNQTNWIWDLQVMFPPLQDVKSIHGLFPVRKKQQHVYFKTLETVLIVTPQSLSRAKRTQEQRSFLRACSKQSPQMQEVNKTRTDRRYHKYKTKPVIIVWLFSVNKTRLRKKKPKTQTPIPKPTKQACELRSK